MLLDYFMKEDKKHIHFTGDDPTCEYFDIQLLQSNDFMYRLNVGYANAGYIAGFAIVGEDFNNVVYKGICRGMTAFHAVVTLREFVWRDIHFDVNELHWFTYGTEEDAAYNDLEQMKKELSTREFAHSILGDKKMYIFNETPTYEFYWDKKNNILKKYGIINYLENTIRIEEFLKANNILYKKYNDALGFTIVFDGWNKNIIEPFLEENKI